MLELKGLSTEQRNEKTMELDLMTPKEIVSIMNEEDNRVVSAVHSQLDQIAEAVEIVTAAFEQDGRLIYMGAGTSGRLGVLDAVECVPTFGVDENKVIGLIAGGDQAFHRRSPFLFPHCSTAGSGRQEWDCFFGGFGL